MTNIDEELIKIAMSLKEAKSNQDQIEFNAIAKFCYKMKLISKERYDYCMHVIAAYENGQLR